MMARKAEPSISELAALIVKSSLGEAIAYNEMEGRICVVGKLPWEEESEFRLKPWGSVEDSFGYSFVQEEFGCQTEKDFQHALKIAASKNRYNPVRQMLENLPEWDGVARLGLMLRWYLGAPEDEYTRQVELLLFRAAIARTYCPGIKFDHMVVLKGAQGIGKSSFCRTLALNPDFFTDCITGFGKKEAAELVQGKWIVEVSELAAMRNSQIETIKAFITRQSDDYRAPYARHAESRPRRFVMVGSTNATAFLSDVTGNRRFLPIECGRHEPCLSLHGGDAEAVFSQAWAEAMVYMEVDGLRSPEPLVLPSHIVSQAKELQSASTVEDPRIGLIGDYLDGKETGDLVCTIEVIENALGIERAVQKQGYQMQVAELIRANFPEWTTAGIMQTAAYGRQRCFEKRH